MFPGALRRSGVRAAQQLSRHPGPALAASPRIVGAHCMQRRVGVLSTSGPARHCSVKVTFIEEGEEVVVDAEVGKTLLEVAHANDIELEGACDGSLACSTCHVILEQAVYDSLDPPEEEEEDMLDLAFDLQDTSRLGCQICVTRDLEGMVATIPSGTHDLRPP